MSEHQTTRPENVVLWDVLGKPGWTTRTPQKSPEHLDLDVGHLAAVPCQITPDHLPGRVAYRVAPLPAAPNVGSSAVPVARPSVVGKKVVARNHRVAYLPRRDEHVFARIDEEEAMTRTGRTLTGEAGR